MKKEMKTILSDIHQPTSRFKKMVWISLFVLAISIIFFCNSVQAYAKSSSTQPKITVTTKYKKKVSTTSKKSTNNKKQPSTTSKKTSTNKKQPSTTSKKSTSNKK